MRIVVVGAGLAGLVAARELAGDHDVLVLDKGRSVGGRLATRRAGTATFDHGAQFFTVRGEPFRRQVDDWLDRGLARIWCRGFAGRSDGHPRYVGTAGMNSLAKDVARALNVRCGAFVFTLHRDDQDWSVITDDASVERADAVVLTCPVPQSRALLIESTVNPPGELVEREYERTIALLAVLDRPSAVPQPGGVQLDPHATDATFGFVADQRQKGISAVPALTCHATVPWSHDNWDRTTDELRGELLRMAEPWIGPARVVQAQVKKWRFATPTAIWPEPCWVDPDARAVLAGDAFAGPKMEGAFNSGLAAAAAVRALE